MIKNQEDVREKTNYLIEVKGLRSNFICKAIDLNRYAFCHFRKGRRNIPEDKLLLLEKFIEEYLQNN